MFGELATGVAAAVAVVLPAGAGGGPRRNGDAQLGGGDRAQRGCSRRQNRGAGRGGRERRRDRRGCGQLPGGQALGGVRDRRRPARRNAVLSDGRAKIGGQWPVRGGYGHLRRRRWRARRQAAVSEREPGNGPAATGPISVRADQADAPAPVRRDSRLGLRTRRLCDDRLRQQRRRRAGRHRRGQLPCACDAWVLCNGRAGGGHALHLTPSGPPRRHRERRRGHRAGSLVRMARWS